jgi:anion-transporting  ArsA/GET3 family ATPase
MDALFEPGILIVSGKGGTGKSTVAAAIASAASAGHLRVLLVEVEGRAEFARTLGIDQPGYVERDTSFGFSVLSITPLDAAVEYLRRYHGMERLTRPLARVGALDQVVRGAPGFRDLLVTGKIYELARPRAGQAHADGVAYDLIVVDAPPTGQLGPFLAAPETFADLVRVGPVKRRAAAVAGVFRRRARVALVAIPEEMAVAETLEALPLVATAGLPVVAVIVNRCGPEVFERGVATAARSLTAAAASRIAGEAGAAIDEETADALLAQARAAAVRRRRERRLIAELSTAGPLVELPDLGDTPAPERVGLLATAFVASKGDGGGRRRDRGTPRVAATTDRMGGARPEAPSGADRRSPAPHHDGGLDDALGDARIVVVCGSGGVGKTTVSAAIAVHMAERGRRTALMTVDPARRLATALRLPPFAGGRPTVPLGAGRSMDALQLDTKRTFDEVVERFAGSAGRAERILSNPFYRRFADTLGGTHEYMAMEKLHQLAEEERHDVIVIDTPPTASAMSFLDAPKRLTDFLGGRFLRLMLWPTATAGRFAFGAARVGARAFLRVAGRLVGAEVLADTVEFLTAFEGMYGGFAARAERVMALLASPACAFVVVVAPTPPSVEEAEAFLARTEDSGMRSAAVVVNRWHRRTVVPPPEAAEAAARLRDGDAEARATAAVLRVAVREAGRQRVEADVLAGAARGWGDVRVVGVPDLAQDVHDVPGLRRMAARLFADPP